MNRPIFQPIFRLTILLQITHMTTSQINFNVKEEQHSPVLLGNIATQAKITSIPDLDFSLLTRKDLFEVDESTGDFKTKTNLDRESLCGSVPSCIIHTSVAVSSAPDFFQRYSINVTVLDINDQKPSFGMAYFPKSISERADVNATIKLPVAFDADCEPGFKVQKYRLEPEGQAQFGLVVERFNKSDGTAEFELHLRLLEKIDREEVGSYMLTLVAADGGLPSNEGRLQVMISVIDENDNRPEFQEKGYVRSVREVAEVGTAVLSVVVHDADDGENGRVGFEFPSDVDRSIFDFFEVNGVSGDVKLISSLENEGGSSFVFKIKAFDHGTPMMSSEVEVRINVEDTVNNPPRIRISEWRFRNDSAVVSEDVVVGAKIALIDVVDTDSGDNGKTSCRASSEYFSLEEYNGQGEYTVSVGRDLDREKIKAHVITIECVDHGVPPLSSAANLTVLVEDVNDNRPEFFKMSYQMSIKENQEAGISVGSVLAHDVDEGLNAEIRYSIDSNIVEFAVDKYNGIVYTSIKGLDREVRSQYTFNVYASDTGLFPLTATTTVTVTIDDENDEFPKFDNSSYKFQVSENSEVNSIIGKVSATDFDLGLGGLVEYLLVHSPLYPNPPYSLSQSDGTLTIIRKLDYELTKQYNFFIIAIDLGKPPRNSSVEIQIEVGDENDNDPVIVFPSKDNLSVTLDLHVTPGYEVMTVLAHDPDVGENGRLTYSFTASSNMFASFFRINEDSGLLTLLGPLTNVEPQVYNISVSVHDNGIPQRATHTLLQVEVVKPAKEKLDNESYILIVIVMASATVFVAVVVISTFCFIKYIDKRKYSNRNDHISNFKPITINPDDFLQIDHPKDRSIDKQITIAGPSINKHVPLSPNRRPGSTKKSVTFDKAVVSQENSTSNELFKNQADSHFIDERSINNKNIDLEINNLNSERSSLHANSNSSLNNLNRDRTSPIRNNSPHHALYDYYTPQNSHSSNVDDSNRMSTFQSRYSPNTTFNPTPTMSSYNITNKPRTNSDSGLPPPSTNDNPRHNFHANNADSPTNEITRTKVNARITHLPTNEIPRNTTNSKTFDLPANESARTNFIARAVYLPANESPRTNFNARAMDLPTNGSPSSKRRANVSYSPANWNQLSKTQTRKVDSTDNRNLSYVEDLGEAKASDDLIDFALEKHNALVMAFVNSNRTPPEKRKVSPGPGVHDLDLCSSSSVETSDSGHGGSDLDISAAKVGL